MTPQASCKYNGHGYNDDGVCIYCKEAMQPDMLKELRDKCFESITARCAEIQLLNEVIEDK